MKLEDYCEKIDISMTSTVEEIYQKIEDDVYGEPAIIDIRTLLSSNNHVSKPEDFIDRSPLDNKFESNYIALVDDDSFKKYVKQETVFDSAKELLDHSIQELTAEVYSVKRGLDKI